MEVGGVVVGTPVAVGLDVWAVVVEMRIEKRERERMIPNRLVLTATILLFVLFCLEVVVWWLLFFVCLFLASADCELIKPEEGENGARRRLAEAERRGD